MHIHGADAVRGAGGCVWLLIYCGALARKLLASVG